MKPKLTTRGRAVLTKAFAAMRRWPDSVDMFDWYGHDPKVRSGLRRPAPYCGTTACVAGHIALAATGQQPDRFGDYQFSRLPKYLRVVAHEDFSSENVALAALGVPEDERPAVSDRLFFTSGWPRELSRRYYAATRPQARAEATIARVRHWLKTGK